MLSLYFTLDLILPQLFTFPARMADCSDSTSREGRRPARGQRPPNRRHPLNRRRRPLRLLLSKPFCSSTSACRAETRPLTPGPTTWRTARAKAIEPDWPEPIMLPMDKCRSVARWEPARRRSSWSSRPPQLCSGAPPRWANLQSCPRRLWHYPRSLNGRVCRPCAFRLLPWPPCCHRK